MVKIDLIKNQHVIKEPENKELLKFFGMVITYPENVTFATQNEGENVVVIIRRHFIKNVGWILNSALLFVAPTILIFLFGFVDTTFFNSEISRSTFLTGLDPNLGNAFLFFYYSICVSFLLLSFIHWYYDLFIVTNERFISIDFDIIKGMIITDIPLQDIIDISEKVEGFFAIMFNFGSIEFKTISEKLMSIRGVTQTSWFRDSFRDLISFIRKQETYEDPFDTIAKNKKPEEPVVEDKKFKYIEP